MINFRCLRTGAIIAAYFGIFTSIVFIATGIYARFELKKHESGTRSIFKDTVSTSKHTSDFHLHLICAKLVLAYGFTKNVMLLVGIYRSNAVLVENWLEGTLLYTSVLLVTKLSIVVLITRDISAIILPVLIADFVLIGNFNMLPLSRS